MHLNATLFGQMITFAIFVWFTMRIIWPILDTQLNERKKRIADGLAAAEQGHKFLASSQEEAKRKINDAKQHCYKMIEEAERQATQIIEASRAQARKERDEIIAAGNAQVVIAVKQAKIDLQTQVAGLVVQGAEKILQRAINPEDHKDILQNLAKNLA